MDKNKIAENITSYIYILSIKIINLISFPSKEKV